MSTTPSPTSYTSPYCASRSAGGAATLGGRNSQAFDVLDIKRESRRVVLVGAEGLTFDDFFPTSSAPPRPAPKPPVQTSQSPLDEINLRFSGLGISLDFPSPPSKSASLSRREPSPTPSDSSAVSSASSSSSRTPSTPPTSDDEFQPHTHLARAPTYKSQRASILYMKSMPDLKKHSLPKTPIFQESEDDWSESEDASWFAQDISDVFTLSSPLPTPTPTTKSFEHKPRPDSIPPPPRHTGCGRASKPLPVAPLTLQMPGRGPSTQLDPTFPDVTTSIANKRRSRFIPSRPPPPPPIVIEPASCPSPTMEEKTEELLKLLADAALDNGFLGTGLSAESEIVSTPVTPSSLYAISTPTDARPPPRMSIPADIFDFTEESSETDVSETGFDIIVTQPEDDVPGSVRSISIYSQASMSMEALPSSPISSFDFDIRTPTASEDPTAGMYSSAQFSSFTTAAADIASPSPTTSAYDFDSASMIRERNLRSRWSSSTLASEYHAHQRRQQIPLSPSAWITRFHLGGSTSTSSSPTKSKAPKPPKAAPVAKVPLSPATKKSLDLESGAGLTRRDSSSSSRTASSDCSSDSGESTCSSGLRRKAIPIELFLRS